MKKLKAALELFGCSVTVWYPREFQVTC